MKTTPSTAGLTRLTRRTAALLLAFVISFLALSEFNAIPAEAASAKEWAIIIGTNIGGMGTLIASMASLITYKNYTRQYPRQKGRYLGVYTAVSVMFLLLMYGLAVIIE